MPRPLNIACLQTRPMPDFDQALTEAMPYAKRAVENGADIIFLPEYCGGLKSEQGRLVPPAAPEHAHPVLKAWVGFAAENSVAVMVGSIAIDGPDGKFINRGYMIDASGVIIGHYDKIHLFDIQLSDDEVYRESDTVSPGNTAVLHAVAGTCIGHTICYDLRFAGLYRDLAQNGAEVLAVPAAFLKKTGQAHWHVLNRARAIENGTFVVSSCAVGAIPGGGESYGHSLIIAPWGEVIADGGDGPGLLEATIDLDKVDEARAKVPSLSHDRPFGTAKEDKRNVA